MTTEDTARPIVPFSFDKTGFTDGFVDFAPHPIAASAPEVKDEEATEEGQADPKDSSAVKPADTSASLTLVSPESDF